MAISHNPVTGQKGLFEDVINACIKGKQETSGWPANCNDETSRRGYIAQYLANEGIELDYDKIETNPGARAIWKSIVNSLWGKFGQRENMGQTELVNSFQDLIKLLNDEKIEMTSLLPVNDELLYVHYRSTEDHVVGSGVTNVAIAAYTTAQARLKLFSYLDKLGKRVLYFDTDSVIYVENTDNDHEYKVPFGDFLGDMTDELAGYGEGSYIKTFVSPGPKFYTYLVVTPGVAEIREICKVKGVTLNYVTKEVINFESIKAMVLGEKTELVVKLDAIRRLKHHVVVTKPETKKCKVTSTKRRFIGLTESVPFGYKTTDE